MRSARDHVEFTMTGQSSVKAGMLWVIASTGVKMTAVIYNFDRPSENDSIDETERLFSALGRYTCAELLELLYVAEEPGFFELMRGLFGLSDQNRMVLQNFLASMPTQAMKASIDQRGRCVLALEPQENPVIGIAH